MVKIKVIGISDAVPMPAKPQHPKTHARTDARREYERQKYAERKEEICTRKREDYRKNRETELKRGLKYRTENPEKVLNASRNWNVNNPEKRAALSRNYINKRCAVDPAFKLLRTIRARLRKALKNESKSGTTVDLLGCSGTELKIYIESLWLPGMTWENWTFRGWHIDHKIALSSFDLTNALELAKACHYTNLQPLWWRDNLVKGNGKQKG